MFGRKAKAEKGILRRNLVTLTDNQGAFLGVLTDSDDRVLVFEDCHTPAGEEIAGYRMIVDRARVAYRQEV